MGLGYLLHTTREGERWDVIAWQYYRDVGQVPALLAANPHAAQAALLPSGLVLRVPLIARATVVAAVPPWRV
ncbi:tail protein X [Rhodoferax sp.]|uniref:tail protein X n=1 Tax=Rhodoferax sp. TaxID=50421 RepID=UPI00260E417D|nr:tail protein X [Rhodoferax sp.]MDD3938077.1 tail protein X [Rhodoferax sp.]